MSAAVPTIQCRKLSSLRPHPCQSLYGDISEPELAALVEDIERFGLRDPIEITDDDLVLDGCQRIRAVGRLGWTEIPCRVYSGLSEDEVESRFLSANLVRRQLGILARARVIKAIVERERTASLRRLDPEREPVRLSAHSGLLRDRVAALLQVSPRTVSRALQLLDLSPVIQEAVDAGRLPMTAALRVTKLPDARKNQITDEILAGGNPAQVIADATRKPKAHVAESPAEPEPEETPQEAYGGLIKFLDDWTTDLNLAEDQIAGTSPLSYPQTIATLDQGTKLLQRLRAAEVRVRKKLQEEHPRVAGIFNDDE